MHQYKSILDLPFKYQNIVDELEESSGELTPEIQELIGALDDEVAEICDNLHNTISEVKAKSDRYDAEIKGLTAKKAAADKSMEGLRSSLLLLVTKYGKQGKTNKSITTDYGTYFTKVTKSVKYDPTAIPDQFKRFDMVVSFTNKETFNQIKRTIEDSEFYALTPGESIDKDQIKALLKAGQEVKGVEIVQTTSVSIR